MYVLLQNLTRTQFVAGRTFSNMSSTNASTVPSATTNSSLSLPPFGHALSKPFASIAATCFLLIMIGSIVCNMLLVFTIFKVKKLHCIMYVFVVNMAISDLIASFGIIPFDIEYMIRGYFPHNLVICGMTDIFFFMSLPSSVFSLLSITAERYFSIVYPTKEMITKRTVAIWLISIWVYILIVSLFPIMYSTKAVKVTGGKCFLTFPVGYQLFQVVINFLIPILMIMLMYAKLFKISYRQANKTARMAMRLGKMQGSIERSLSKDSCSDATSSSAIGTSISILSSLSRNMKAFKRITFLVSVLILCWFSYIVIVMMNYHCLCHPRELTWVANVVNYSSSVLNPVVYGVFDSILRKEMLRTLTAIKRTFKSILTGLF